MNNTSVRVILRGFKCINNSCSKIFFNFNSKGCTIERVVFNYVLIFQFYYNFQAVSKLPIAVGDSNFLHNTKGGDDRRNGCMFNLHGFE